MLKHQSATRLILKRNGRRHSTTRGSALTAERQKKNMNTACITAIASAAVATKVATKLSSVGHATTWKHFCFYLKNDGVGKQKIHRKHATHCKSCCLCTQRTKKNDGRKYLFDSLHANNTFFAMSCMLAMYFFTSTIIF